MYRQKFKMHLLNYDEHNRPMLLWQFCH